MSTIDFIQKLFLQYYSGNLDKTSVPHLFEKREFAALLLKEKAMVRHKSFRDLSELQNFLCKVIPSDVYYSSAYYERPDAAEMSLKEWTGADLVFDIDADHIPTPCDKIHDEWVCGKCGFAGKGVIPERCPACGGEKLDDSTWPCEICLTSAKAETIRLLKMLMCDFAFSEKEVRAYFSGHRGYHVQVTSEATENLDSSARKEIVDYVLGLGFDASLQGLDETGLRTFGLKNPGFRGRIAKQVFNLILNSKPEGYRDIGVKRNVVEAMMKNKDVILENWSGAKPWKTVKGIGPETWKKVVEHSVKSQSANIDSVVTTDIHRLIRLAGTLHGKTGLKKVEMPILAIDDFDPFRNAIAFRGGTATILVSSAPEFRIGDETFGPYRNQKVELPTAAALLLVCKKRAEVVD